MAKKSKKSEEVIIEKSYVKVVTKTLQIKSGDLVRTSSGWRETVSDAYRNDNGYICVEIADYGEWKWMSYDQTITVKR